MEIVFTALDFIAFIVNVALNYQTGYMNYFPYNCGYYDGTKWTFDCWNFIKAVIWGWDASTVVGSYTYNPGLHGLGDWNGITILNHCTNVGYNFENLTRGCYLYLEDVIDHAGIYIGNYEVNGLEYNVCEATPIWNDGVQLTWVDPDGTRRRHKNGEIAGQWTAHGLLPWIDYSDVPPVPPESSKLPLLLMSQKYGI